MSAGVAPEGSASLRRARALAERVSGHPEHMSDALPELADLLASTRDGGDDDALAAVVSALGQAGDPRATELLLPLAAAGHPDAEVRTALARALSTGTDVEPVRTRAVAALVAMTTDPDEDVRDWACFALGMNDAADPSSCDALAARLDDPHRVTRDEALRALAATGDRRALAAVRSALTGPTDAGLVSLLQIEAAAELADPSLLAPLGELARRWADDEDDFTAAVDIAVRRCRPEAALAAARVEGQLQDVAERARRSGAPHGRLIGSWPRTRVEEVGATGRPTPGQVMSRLWWADDDPARASPGQLIGTSITPVVRSPS